MRKEEFLKEAVQVNGYSSNAWEINAVQNKRTNISEPWVSDLAKIRCARWNDLKKFLFNLDVRDCALVAAWCFGVLAVRNRKRLDTVPGSTTGWSTQNSLYFSLYSFAKVWCISLWATRKVADRKVSGQIVLHLSSLYFENDKLYEAELSSEDEDFIPPSEGGVPLTKRAKNSWDWYFQTCIKVIIIIFVDVEEKFRSEEQEKQKEHVFRFKIL